MDRFKNILRMAVGYGAYKIQIDLKSVITLIGPKGEKQLAELGANAPNWLYQVCCFLYEKNISQYESGQVSESILDVDGLGRVQILAQKSKTPFLYLYLPPAGDSFYQKDLQTLKAVSSPQLREKTTDVSNATDALRPKPLTSLPNSTAQEPLQKGMMNFEHDRKVIDENPNMNSLPVAGGLEVGVKEEVSALGSAADALPTFDQEIQMDMEESAGNIPQLETPAPLEPVTNTTLPIDEERGGAGSSGRGDFLAAPPDDTGATPATEVVEPLQITGSLQSIENQVEVVAPNHHSSSVSPTRSVETSEIFYGAEIEGSTIKSRGQNPIDELLSEMLQKRSSDLHLTVGQPVMYRIDGHIERVGAVPIDPARMKTLLDPIIPNMNKHEFVEVNDSDFAYAIEGVGRFRVNIFRDRNGVGSVIRHIPEVIPTADDLDLPKAIRNLCGLRKGLVLVTGPTGSGKSTTLAAMIDLINKSRKEHIITIEDPVEFVHTSQQCLINQRDVGKHTDSFANALRAALREDPDIVLIGEMRDLETVSIAIETAETGHLVFGTLHTTTAVSTVDRLIDQFPGDQQEQIRAMLSNSLKGVISQTLLRKKGGGRVAAHEILIPDSAVANNIRKSDTHMVTNHMQTQKAMGNQLLNDALIKLVKAGIVQVEEAYSKSVDKKDFLETCQRQDIRFNPDGGVPGSVQRAS